jgi:hypothetical protein
MRVDITGQSLADCRACLMVTCAGPHPGTIMSRILFSTIDVTSQVFYHTNLTAAIVNLKPIVPGRTS